MPSRAVCPNVEAVAIRVLLVDDVPEVRRLVKTALRFRGVFTVVGEAANGAEAIAQTTELRPDIVVLDIGLPDIAGKDLANPLASVLSFAMMLRHSFDQGAEADVLEKAVDRVLAAGFRTADIMTPGGKQVSTGGMGDALLQELERLAT